MSVSRRIAMVAHDNKKVELLTWAEYNVDTLHQHELFRDWHHRHGAGIRAGVEGASVPVRADGRGPADRREDRRGRDRHDDLLLGSAGAPTA